MSGSNNSEQHPAGQTPTNIHHIANGDLAIRSGRLFGGNRQVLIEHAGQTYRLHITRSNKLILTK